MKLTNTLTRQKEVFKPLKEEKVKVYFCGPTPYNYSHIGNLRTYIYEDIIIKTLRFLGFKIESTMNITDIDDKTIRDSIKTGVSLFELTTKYTEIFFEDLEKLWIQKADNVSPISELIDEMVLIINGLLAKWYAYLADDGSIYYSISKFNNYWKLAHLDLKWMKQSVRINNDEYEKEEVADFVLWKAYDETRDWPNKWKGEFEFELDEKNISPKNKNNEDSKTENQKPKTIIWWRPGWHIECSACNLKFFWPQIDLHMWAVDNIFPHHQNEIAQTEAYTGKTFSKYWLHTGHLLVDNKKMSKSLGNFYTLRDLEETTGNCFSEDKLYRWYRLMVMQSKYADSFNFSFDKLKQAVDTLKNFDEVLKRIKYYKGVDSKFKKDVSQNMQFFMQNFITYLEDDFDLPNALTVVFDLVRYTNSWIDDNYFSQGEIKAVIDLFKSFDQVLTIFDWKILDSENNIPEEISQLLEKRTVAKKEKNFDLADSIRQKIESKWYKIVDDKEGSRIET